MTALRWAGVALAGYCGLVGLVVVAGARWHDLHCPCEQTWTVEDDLQVEAACLEQDCGE